MNDLILLRQRTIGNELVETVNARELHSFLEVQTRFNDWIATRISEYDFVENQDYVRFTENPVKPQGGRPSMGYFITLGMAKELAMVERNKKGKQARKYFIECEERLKVNKQPVQPIGKMEDAVRGSLLLSQHLNIEGPALETFLVTTTERILGIEIPYRPLIEQRTYSARELGDVLGISANKVGRLANEHGLKIDKYGMLYLSKSEHSTKQVETWRYYDNVIPILKDLLAGE